MISNIFNITYSIEESILDEWELWFKKFQSALIQSEHVNHVRYLELKGQQEPGHVTRCVHLEFENTSKVHRFYSANYVEMGEQLTELFGEKCLYFGSLLELISENNCQ